MEPDGVISVGSGCREFGAEPMGASEGTVGGHVEISGLNFVVGERTGERIEIFAVIGIGESFVRYKRTHYGAGDDGGVPFGIVKAWERDGFGLSRKFAGGFEAPIAVKRYGGGRRIISIGVCSKSRAEDECEREQKDAAKPGH